MQPVETLIVTTRYEQIAEQIRQQIDNKTFAVEDRLPSVRAMARQMQVSVSTVIAAYSTLENQGIIEVRPQSGHYIIDPDCSRIVVQNGSPARPPSQISKESIAVGIGKTVLRYLGDFQRPDLLQLGGGGPDPEALPLGRLSKIMARVSRQELWLANCYDIPPGCEALRTLIAKRAMAAGCVVSLDDVLLTTGCQEALSLALAVSCHKGDTVAVASPTFYGHLQALEMLGLSALEIPADPTGVIDLAVLEQVLAAGQAQAVLMSPNFANPHGASLSDTQKAQLIGILKQQGVPLIEDDIFGELSHALHRPRAVRSFDDADLVLLCSSVSKTLSPGYRVGWVISSPRYRSKLRQRKFMSNLASPSLQALVVAEFLANGGYDHHLRACRRTYSQRTHQLTESVTRYFPNGTKVSRARGGYLMWIELPGSVDTTAIYPQAVRAGFTFAPGAIFSAHGQLRNCLRLSASGFSSSRDWAVKKLAALIHSTS